jgi:biopolymer transport protein ExbB
MKSCPLRLSFLTALAACWATTALAAADAPESANLFAMLRQGGWAMFPLGLCSLVALALIVHSARETAAGRFVPRPLLGPMAGALEARDFAGASALANGSETVLGRCLASALARARPAHVDAGRPRMEEALMEGFEAEESSIAQWINYLNVVAGVAPMVGLLGTVSGMIGAFQTISSGGMGRPELLAGDIGEALITTATGLVIGIPAMVAYFVLRNRLTSRMLATAQAASTLLDQLDAAAEISLVDD